MEDTVKQTDTLPVTLRPVLDADDWTFDILAVSTRQWVVTHFSNEHEIVFSSVEPSTLFQRSIAVNSPTHALAVLHENFSHVGQLREGTNVLETLEAMRAQFKCDIAANLHERDVLQYVKINIIEPLGD